MLSRWKWFLTTLMQNDKIYILPTRFGLLYLFVILIMILVGATYSNNLIYLLGFFMFSVFVSSMIQTHNNLKGIQVQVTDIEDSYENDPSKVILRFQNKSSRTRQSLRVIPKQKSIRTEIPAKVDVMYKAESTRSYVYLKSPHRGQYVLKDLVVYTVYPMGLFKAWKYSSQEAPYYVYPSPIDQSREPERMSMEEALRAANHSDNVEAKDDFKEHRSYQQGESSHHIDWKVYAKRKEFLVKTFESPEASVQSFNIHKISHLGIEKSLMQISYWILKASKEDKIFELILPGSVTSPGRGRSHMKRCLRSLASHPHNSPQVGKL